MPAATIIARSDGCTAVTRGSVSYTCRNTGPSIAWRCEIFSQSIVVIGTSTTHLPNLNVTGVTVAENFTYNPSIDCLESTLKLSGSLENLQPLNGLLLECQDDNVTIVIPSELIRYVWYSRVCIPTIEVTACMAADKQCNSVVGTNDGDHCLPAS